ncbi:glutaredoxin 3 [Candidatus Albibeggiatoa sp. nov. BB20]|uniref:glutaredoxin 3 n=1 Tax=Candidatus Albibeggiatoa sp. nov. BB20 TaxID=3162723 RepID=UPI00336575B3
MPKVVMYSTQICPYCMRAEHLLRNRGVEHIEKIMIDREPEKMQEMMQLTGRRTVPQVFIGGKHIGGFDDLSELDMEDGLLPLLEAD